MTQAPKQILPFLLLLLPIFFQAQITGDAPPFVLNVEQLKNWTPDGPTASADNIATESLAPRFSLAGTQLNPDLSTDIKILSAPDGMNNLGNYTSEQAAFNLFNFTHWQYIDVLNWFGGTASQNVVLPSAPWVNAAHRNGVKVIGSVFFAPTVFGGNTQVIESFLEKDEAGNYIAADKLIAIAGYYGFDGWLINQETSTSLAVATEMRAFMAYLQENRPAHMEIHWYDAMIETGPVIWQNQLNALNDAYLEDLENLSRTADAMFTNYNWNSLYVSSSSNYANVLGRSEFDVYMGADLWPDRNAQPAFEDVNWINSIFNNGDLSDPLTSIALFATNFTFFRFNDFASNPNDVEGFYDTERRFFSGDDRDIDLADGSGQWKGLGHYIPARSVVSSLPFETSFNTGHGRISAVDGYETIKDWHDMDQQDILPSWQFSLTGSSPLTASFDFTTAYNGGTSIKVSGHLDAGAVNQLKLYKTKLPVSAMTKIDLTCKTGNTSPSHAKVIVSFSDDPLTFFSFEVGDSPDEGWNTLRVGLGNHYGKEIAVIGLEFNTPTVVDNYTFHIGQISVHNENTPLCDMAISSLITIPETCPGSGDGSITVLADCSSCTGVEYTIDGVNFQLENTFEGLAPGAYTVGVRDTGNPACDDSAITTVAIGEDALPPVVTAELIPLSGAEEEIHYEVHCSATDNCDPDPMPASVIEIPQLSDPAIIFEVKFKRKLHFKFNQNQIIVRGPDPQAFWSEVMADEGIAVADGQMVTLEFDDIDEGGDTYVYKFDSEGRLIRVVKPGMTLRCTAADAFGNTGSATATVTVPGDGDNETDSDDDNDEVDDDGNDLSAPSQGSVRTLAYQDQMTPELTAYPNPFFQTITIAYALPNDGPVAIRLFDLHGRLIATMIEGKQEAGAHQRSWYGGQLPAGSYTVHLRTKRDLVVQRLVKIQ